MPVHWPIFPPRLRRSGSLAAAITLIAASPLAHALEPQVRGTWLTTTGPDHIVSGYRTEAVVGQLHDIGINTLYTEAWKNGNTQFGSETLNSLLGRDRSPGLGDRDLLAEVGIQAHRHGQANIAWFEYGFAAQHLGPGRLPTNPLATLAQDRGWLLEDQAGQYANGSNGFAWMNPAVPEVHDLLINLTLEAIRTHDLDGIQFDDRLAWPKAFGWDDTTAEIYRQETGRSLPSDTDNPGFRRWRQSKVTQFATDLSQAVRAERPDIELSISPSPTGFSDVNYNAKWTDWVEAGLFDEYVPQLYRDDVASFRQTLEANLAVFKATGQLDRFVAGLRFNGSGADTPTDVVKQQIVDAALAEDGELAGHSLFYSKGLIDHAEAIKTFYGDQRDSSFFDPNRRPDPLVAFKQGGRWHVTLDDAEMYQVVAQTNGRWRVVDGGYYQAGMLSLSVDGATAVELLLDRRPIPGDTNFDRRVDDTDLLTLAEHLDGIGHLPQGDFNHDGRVDATDVGVFRDYWQVGVAPDQTVALNARLAALGVTIPEPGSAVCLLGVSLLLFRRSRSARR